MKKYFVLSTFFLLCMQMKAQEIQTVVLGDIPLSEQFRSGVTELNIIGNPTNQDIEYLRDKVMGDLSVLNLKDAVIDTLHQNELDLWTAGIYGYSNHLDVYLPSCLSYMEQHSLKGGICLTQNGGRTERSLTAFITGYSPVFSSNTIGCDIEVSEGNDCCIQCKDENRNVYITSSKGDTLFYITYNDVDRIDIPEGVETLSEGLFNGMILVDGAIINFPSTLGFVGKKAFAGFWRLELDCECPKYEYVSYFICMSVQPPKMHPLSIDDRDFPAISSCALFVPDESVEAYQEADGWNKFALIKGISEFGRKQSDSSNKQTTDIKLLSTDNKKIETRPVRLKKNNAGGFDLEVRSKNGEWKTVLP